MLVVLIILGVVVAIVAASIVGARRGTPMAFEASDPADEAARAAVRYYDGMGPTAP
jgi:hypothetical protein